MDKKIIIVGSGVAGISAALKLVDNNYPGELITIIDKGNNPYNRKPEEVMTGFAGAGGFSDGKLTYHTEIGGQLSKYCGEEKAYDLMDQSIEMWKRFHPDPSKIMYSNPVEEPNFIKPYFGLRLFPVYHIGTNYLHEIAKAWYSFLTDAGVNFIWNCEVKEIDFNSNLIKSQFDKEVVEGFGNNYDFEYDELIFAVGKSGIDFAQKLADDYKLPNEPKSVQIGVRFEAPQKYFQKLIDISYDFKLYQKFDNVSLRSFCTNNNAAYVAVEETYGDVTYNGHAKKGEEFRNDMTNFGILMEIKGIEDPFKWSRDVVKQLQAGLTNTDDSINFRTTGLYYSPSRTLSTTSEGATVSAVPISLDALAHQVEPALDGYFKYVWDFIQDMNKIFEFGDDWGMYIPEVKYLSPEPLVRYHDLSLNEYPNVHFVGDALSARGITVSGAHGIYVAESLIRSSLLEQITGVE
jgi:uncharacterized FAD-dependent dehydrogenase